MRNFKLNLFLVALTIIVFSIAFFRPNIADAASLGLFIDKENPVVGDTLVVDLKIDSEDESINAAQATVKFPSNILKSQSIDKTDSIFNFWLDEPSSDNDLGEISFIGGSTISGYSGKSLQVLRMKFKVIGNGEASLVFSDTAISSADGSGSNVLSTSKGISFSVLSKSEIGKIQQAQITREAEVASNLPAKPVLSVSLYSNPENWYNLVSDFSASWNLPKDITDVATSLDKVPSTNPTKSEGLFDNKVFKSLSNGIWYLHIRFKNNIGWGVTNHYRIAIDSLPPLPFKVEITGNPISDNPIPEIKFTSSDQFAGIEYYQILVDGKEDNRIKETTYTFKPIAPGKHKIIVSARDKAGNVTEGRLDLEVLPIQSPEILFINRNVFIGEGGLFLNGSSLPSSTVLYNLKLKSGENILQGEVASNDKGFWSIDISQPLKKGSYIIEITAKDSRGALSFPVESNSISITERPVLVLGRLNVTYQGLSIILILFFAISFFLGWLFRHRADKQRNNRIVIAERDVNAMLVNIDKDIKSIIKDHKIDGKEPLDSNVEVNVNYILNKIGGNIERAKKYILENIEEIG